MKLAALLVAVAVLAACGGGTQAPQAISVSDVKHAFADAGLPLRATAAPPVGSVGDDKASRRAAEQTEADLTWSGPGTEVTVFRTARYTAQVAKEIGRQLPTNVSQKRISNVLITWVGAEAPALQTAIRHLS